MSLTRRLLRWTLGKRLVLLAGTMQVEGPQKTITIRRDQFGIPTIEASSEADAWFGLGFCHGQDRAFQLELYLRLSRGTLAALVGPQAVPIDRISRRVGFRRASLAQLNVLAPGPKAVLEAYVRGVNAGATSGSPQRAHEFAILRRDRTAWDVADPLGFSKLQSFLMSSNWDVELARLSILAQDGPEALRALDPSVFATSTSFAGEVQSLLHLLGSEISKIGDYLPFGAASNNWAIAGSRTESGRPLLASDPHLAPQAPSQWYLASLRTPDWSVSGASMVGVPTIPIGHNGFAAWGVTAGLLDNTDLFIERLGPDRWSVQRGGDSVSCDAVSEVIDVRGSKSITEEVRLTSNGPVISNVGPQTKLVFALRATWLDPLPLDGWLSAHRARSFEEFRRPFADWPVLPQNLVYADEGGHIGWLLVGAAPVRKGEAGPLPTPGWNPANGWNSGLVPFDQMPRIADPPEGFVASANNAPRNAAVNLGIDWLEDHRIDTIEAELRKHGRWTMGQCDALQMNVESSPWRDIREAVLGLPATHSRVKTALEILGSWDGRVAGNSPAAAVFELFFVALARRATRAKAPRSWRHAIGEGFALLHPDNFFCHRRVGHLVNLIRSQPAGWFADGWPAAFASALSEAVDYLQQHFGPNPADWAWGRVRPLRFRHPVFRTVASLAKVFDIGPVAYGGDTTTVSQSSVHPLDATRDPTSIPGVRAVMDVGRWDHCRFALAGGQSGNPFSPHYDDLFLFWAKGTGITLPWTAEQIASRTRHVLTLEPEKQAP